MNEHTVEFDVIYADPAWRFEVFSRETGLAYSADKHYMTAPVEEMATIPVELLAAKNCALFMWVTMPMLAQALELGRHGDLSIKRLLLYGSKWTHRGAASTHFYRLSILIIGIWAWAIGLDQMPSL